VGSSSCPASSTQSFNESGSGITLYAINAYAAAFTIGIDGGALTKHEIEGVPGCCTNATLPTSNYSFFDIKSLPNGAHRLILTLLNATTGYLAAPMNSSSSSMLDFDFAVVDTSMAHLPSSSTSSLISSPTSVPTASPASSPVPSNSQCVCVSKSL
jgi:hypothetical protein